VAVSFTAPAEDMPTDITLTSTTGLTAGDTIQIGTGFYFLSAIKPNNVITIVNRGEGIVPGTPVVAQDANGEFQYCISTISENPCDRDLEVCGTVLACVDGVIAPISVNNEGDVLWGTDAETDTACFAPLDVAPPECAQLTADLSLVAADPTYTIEVDDTTGFSIDDILIVGSYDFRSTITAVVDATHLDITVSPVPAVNVVIPAPQKVCQIGCCEELRNTIAEVSACVVQGQFFSLTPELYNQAIGLTPPDNYYETTLDATLISVTAPSTCPDATYAVEASLNVTAVVYATSSTVPGTDYNFTSEIQADWANNAGVGGRINWTGPWPHPFGMPYSTAAFPVGTLNPIWNTLQLFRDAPPTQVVISYNGAYVNPTTILAAGASTTLRLNLKILTDDQFTTGDGEIVSAGVYVVGSHRLTRIT
jgi:hypothetical protein